LWTQSFIWFQVADRDAAYLRQAAARLELLTDEEYSARVICSRACHFVPIVIRQSVAASAGLIGAGDFQCE
jgi:hypothetical protein